MTDPLPNQPPLSEAEVRAALERAEAVFKNLKYTDAVPGKMGGKVCIAGHRMPLAQLIADLADGMSVTEFAQNFEIEVDGTQGAFAETACLLNLVHLVPALARECLRLRGLLAEAADEGRIWSAIRGALPGLRESLHSAAYAEGYERESAYFDGIAAKLAAAVATRVRAHLNPTETPDA